MATEDKTRLLFGPYQTPRLKPGSRANCLFRDRLVVVSGLTNARLPWPLCRPAFPPWGGAGLLVDETLVRAICHESALAIRHWWGIGRSTIQRWRKAFGVGRMDAEGSRRLILSNIQSVIESHHEAEAQHCGVWANWEIALLGMVSDREAARQTGRSLDSVRGKRRQLGKANPDPRSQYYPGRPWTDREDALVARLPVHEVALRTGRSLGAVYQRRKKLGLKG